MENTFTINGKVCRVTLERTGLTWRLQNSSQGEFRVPAAEIISCWSCPKGSLKCCPHQEAQTNNCPQNGAMTSDDSETKLSTVSATYTSSLSGGHSGLHYGTTETNDESPQSHSVVNADLQTYTRPPPSSTSANAQSEKLDDGSSCRPQDRLAGLPFRECTHSRKVNTRPALAVEICERVLPSALVRGCLRGDGERVVATWKPRVLVLQHAHADTVREWLTALWQVVAGSPWRPRRLLVIVNPVSGNKNAEKIYNSRVAPLFRRAAIRVTLKKTTHSGHAEELAETAAAEGEVDGVVAVSGDGTFAEAVAGLMKAAARQLGERIHDSRTPMPAATLACGLIPSGSTNSYSTSSHGTEDTSTSVLQIIMGSRRYFHVGGIYIHDRLVQVCTLNAHGGFLGGLIERTYKLRHLGAYRNIIAGITEFFSGRSCECEIRYLAEENVDDLLRLDEPECRANCTACQAPAKPARQNKGEWRQVRGDFFMSAINLLTAENRFTKYGMSPMCHTNNGYCDIIMVPKMSQLSLIPRLFRLQSTRDEITKPPIQAIRTSELHYRSLTQSSRLNFDGEFRDYQEFVLKMHRDCLPVYSRGREPLSTLDLSTLTNNFK